jgi:hypothetical protein
MLSTKIISNLNEVPVTWVYETYCRLTESLTGQDVKLKSIFNSNDKNPSFSIYFKNGTYKWTDFSVGKGGDHINLVQYLFDLDYVGAVKKIMRDYQSFIKLNKDNYSANIVIPQARYSVTSVKARSWNNLDAMYWTAYNIDSDVLSRFNVRALEEYVFSTEDDSRPPIVKTGNFIYGFFNSDGLIMKIYQPRNPDMKFIKVRDYIQGVEQLQYNQPNLIITKSLKDVMCLSKFGYNAEFIAVESEGTALRPEIVNIFKVRYKSICTLFDNDHAGTKAMHYYKDVYGINGIQCKIEKDPSDCIQKFGFTATRDHLTPLLKEVLKKQ